MGQDHEDDLVWDKDRLEHSTHRPEFTWHTGVASYRPQLRISRKASGPDRQWMRLVIHERGIHKGRQFHNVWAVYAFSDLARWACDCVMTGDRLIVVGLERGTNTWVDAQGQRHKSEDITAWDIGMSMLRNPAYSERNENKTSVRSQRRVEEGYGPVDHSLIPEEYFDGLGRTSRADPKNGAR